MFSILHWNIQCIRNKTNAIEHILQTQQNFDVLCFSEHWLNLSNKDLYVIKNYKCASIYCRSTAKNGGAGIWVKNSVAFKELCEIKNLSADIHCEAAGILLKYNNIVLIAVYRSTDGDLNQFLCILENILLYVFKHYQLLILVGDFNVNFKLKNSACNSLINLLSSFGLKQTIFDYTRCQNGSNSLIDNIFTNVDEYVANVCCLHLSDHEAQVISFPPETTKRPEKYVLKRYYSTYNLDYFKYALYQVDWHEVYNASNTDLQCSIFHNKFINCLNMCMPLQNVKVQNNIPRKNNHFDNEISCAYQTLGFLYDACKTANNMQLWEKYRNYKKYYLDLIESANRKKYVTQINSASNKPKKVWEIINKELGRDKKLISENTNLDSEKFSNSFLEAVDILSRNFNSTYPSTCTFRCDKSIFFEPITENEIHSKIMKYSNKSSNDIYFIQPFILKDLTHILAPILCFIFNNCLCEGIFPQIWKCAKVVPVFKKGDVNDPLNYRPISVLPFFSKIFESMILDRMLQFAITQNFLSTHQFAFRKNSSTNDAIFSLTNFITSMFDKKYKSTALFCDLSKAFDSVSHEILLNKLDCYGFRGTANKLLKSYLRDRSQTIFFNNMFSSQHKLNCGIPQGSILGPFLFLLYVNDLPASISCHTILFADDTTFCCSQPSEDSLNEQIRSVKTASINWFTNNRLLLNESKTVSLQFSLNKNNDISFAKFLGIYVDSKLSWKIHIQYLCDKLSKAIYAIRNVRKISNIDAALSAYYGLFQSVATYGIVIWGVSPCINQIFQLQKRVIRAIEQVNRFTSCRTLFIKHKLLTIPSLFIYHSLLHVKHNSSSYLTQGDTHQYNTRYRDKFAQSIHKFKITECNEMKVSLYNHLPLEIRNKSENSFRKAIKSTLINKCLYSVEEFFKSDFN